MALSKITYEDKETLNEQPSIADKNKVSDDDMNEIKRVVNAGIDQIDTNTTNIRNISGTILWTNSNPSSNFNGQTINISNLSSYVYIDIAYFVYKDNKKQCVQRHYYDTTYKNGELMSVFTNSSRGYIGTRQFTVNADNIQFQTNQDFRRSGDANGFELFADDGWTIPYKIIGYK